MPSLTYMQVISPHTCAPYYMQRKWCHWSKVADNFIMFVNIYHVINRLMRWFFSWETQISRPIMKLVWPIPPDINRISSATSNSSETYGLLLTNIGLIVYTEENGFEIDESDFVPFFNRPRSQFWVTSKPTLFCIG